MLRKGLLLLCLLPLLSCTRHDIALALTNEIRHDFEYVLSENTIRHPDDVVESGYGDCADLSLLLAVRMVSRGLRPVLLHHDMGWLQHMNVEYDGVIYDPVGEWKSGHDNLVAEYTVLTVLRSATKQ